MLAELPEGTAVASHTRNKRGPGETPTEYLSAHYGHFFDGYPFRLPDLELEPAVERADAFVLHATILRQQLEGMLATSSTSSDDDAIALAGLFSRVSAQPRGPWDAEDLASALGVSRTTLYRSVKRHHGTSPAKLVERLRMEAACRLLLESRHSIDIVADQVGYASAFSFSAAFKRIVGERPSQFRTNAVANVPEQ
jgi:AraC-like DNA-binding protein